MKILLLLEYNTVRIVPNYKSSSSTSTAVVLIVVRLEDSHHGSDEVVDVACVDARHAEPAVLRAIHVELLAQTHHL